jgi:hypothetical protein
MCGDQFEIAVKKVIPSNAVLIIGSVPEKQNPFFDLLYGFKHPPFPKITDYMEGPSRPASDWDGGN